MFKNILLLLTIFVIFSILVATSYLLKDGNDCCNLEICQKVFKSCNVDSESVLKSTKQVEFVLDNIGSGDTIESGYIVEGSVTGNWYWEGQFSVDIYDKEGMPIESFIATATKDSYTDDLVPFKVTIDYPFDEDTDVVLRFNKANASGLLENDDSISIDITIKATETITLKVFYPSTKLSDMSDCSIVFPVSRKVPYTEAVGRASLEKLFEGPTASEMQDKYFTNIPQGVVINDLRIENGIAYVDFSEELQYQVGGSCRVESIRAQITETLKQFPTVDDVVISIDGQTEDILQP